MESKMLHTLKGNWKSGLTVSLVSIPLSLALAIASGASPTQGIITAFWAGLLASFFGGSNYNITGPTGALSGVLVSYAILHGAASLPIIAVLAGVLIFVSYLLGLEKYILFIPKSVVHGFTLGVAFIIALGQIDNALGLVNIPKTEVLLQNVWASLQHISEIQWPVFAIFIFSTIFIILWNKRFPKIPGAILVASAGILFTTLTQDKTLPFHLLTLGDKYLSIEATLFQNTFSQFSWELLLKEDIWFIAIATTLIAILETLLSAKIADNITKTKFNPSKEVLGLAIANIGSGLMGGIPATAALARTALNIKSGADHKTSATISSIFIGIIALFLFSFFKLLPMAIIAAILMTVALGMVEKKHFIHLMETDRSAFFLSLFVAILTVVKDPIVGIIVGTFIALLIFANKVSYGQTEVLVWKKGKLTDSLLKNEFIQKAPIHSDVIVYKISGTMTYINMPAHLEAVKKIKDNKIVIISLRHAFYADSDGIEYLKELIETIKKTNQKVVLTGVNREIEKQIKNEDFYKKKLIEGKIYKRTSEALSDLL